MAERSFVDLTHSTLSVMDIGRMQLLTRIPVIAGDSFEMNSSILVRLQQLRRPLALDVKADVYLFYCPYRYSYGEQWINYIEAGGKEAVTFPTVSTSVPQHWLQYWQLGIPKHLLADGINIWNQWFRDPAQAEIDINTFNPANDTAAYGLLVNHLKTWGTAQAKRADLAGTQYEHTVVGNKIRIQDIQSLASRSRNESYRDFISSRYQEIVEGMSGGELHDYADNVPELVWKEESWLSGYDVNGTAGAELGQVVGKAVGSVNFNMPRRFFAEHGTLYMFCVLRLPPVFEFSRQYLDTFNRPYHEVVPQGGVQFAPVELKMSDVWSGAGASGVGFVPMWEWYRDHPSYCHPRFFDSDAGWQTLDRPSSWGQSVECSPKQYDAMFASMKLRHAVVSVRHNINAWRPIPDGYGSVMGTF